jgi:hypothetical protein
MHDAFDEYLEAIQEDTFRYAYQCGYEKAQKDLGQSRNVLKYLPEGGAA